MGRVALSALFYFLVVFGVGFVLGPIRVLVLEPRLGPMLAVLCEAPVLILAMWFAANAAPKWARLTGGVAAHFSVGLIALALQQAADWAVGFGLRGMTLRDQLNYFASPPGHVYLATLIAFLFMPLVRYRMRKGAAL
jgi:hypothetical protein